ncbi:MAG: WD40 repeat domain-containing protein [Pirellulaceae bacterium]
MLMSKLKAALVAVLVLGFVVTGAFTVLYQTAAAQGDKPPIAEERGKMPQNKEERDKEAVTPRPKLPKPAEPGSRGPLAVAVTASGKEVGVQCDTFAGHTAAVYSVVFSPDGKTLASGSEDNTIKLWDVKTGIITATLEGHTKTIWSVAFSPDGKTLASGSEDKTIKLWDVKTGKNTATIEGRTETIWSVAFSPDGKTLASAGGIIKLWDVTTGKNTATFGDEGSGFVAFSPDGKLLASGANGIKSWDVTTSKNTVIYKGHSNLRIASMALSPNGKMLAGGELGPFRSSVKLWDVTTGKDTGIQGGTTYAVAFSPDGAILASVGGKTIQFSEVTTGKSLATLKADGVWVGGRSLAFSPDGETLAAGGLARDFSIKLWDVANLTDTPAASK